MKWSLGRTGSVQGFNMRTCCFAAVVRSSSVLMMSPAVSFVFFEQKKRTCKGTCECSPAVLLFQAPQLWSHRMYLRALNKPGLSQVTNTAFTSSVDSHVALMEKV